MNDAVYSMTGFATAKLPTGLTLDIRSVNSRFLDLSFKLPDSLRHLEAKLREVLTAQIRRGKCEVRVNVSSASDSTPTATQTLDPQLVHNLLAQQALIRELAPTAALLTVAEILSLAKDKSTSSQSTAIDDADVLALCQTAVCAFNEARALEGGKLASIMRANIQELQRLRELVIPLVPALIEQQRQRFLQKFADAMLDSGGKTGGKISATTAEERALSEATAFAIRIDITEEVDRLGSHLTEIDHLLANGGGKKGQELGKRLEFLIQELHREANTLGSKSATLETTKISVDMKVLIEQLREQIQNIE
jgi:uncharacterized protein (TIGR00255 family)